MNKPKRSLKGKRFKKRIVSEFENTSEGVEAACNETQTVLKMLEDMVIYAKKTLANKGYDSSHSFSIFRGNYFDRESMSNEERDNLKKENLFIESDSEEADLVNLWQSCEIAANKKNNIEHRLDYAFRAGDYFRRIAVYADYGKSQSKSASQERKKGLNEIFEKLKKRKAAGEKPQELWPEFISMLQERHEIYDQVQEETTNPANSKTWKVSFLIIADKDGEPQKEVVMKFARFRRRLSNK